MTGELKLKDVVCNRNFDVNCEYEVYLGVHDDGGELLWSSQKDGKLSEDDPVANMSISYMTVDTKLRIIFEVL